MLMVNHPMLWVYNVCVCMAVYHKYVRYTLKNGTDLQILLAMNIFKYFLLSISWIINGILDTLSSGNEHHADRP